MDSFKSLLEKKQYDLVISLTSAEGKEEDLFFRLAAYLGKGDSQKAADLFFKNRDRLYAFNPLLTMKTNFELRDILKQYDKAYEDEPYFENKPYVSQEVEEYLRDLPKLIRIMERNSSLSAGLSSDKVDGILKTSKDDYQILTLLSAMTGAMAKEHITAIKTLLVSSRHSEVKTYAFLLLISARCAEEVTFTKNGKIYHLVPAETNPPYSGKIFSDFLSYLRKAAGDPSVSGIAESLLNDYILDVYPEEVLTKSEDPLLASALLKIARSYLRNDQETEETHARYALEKEAVDKEAEKIALVLKKHPPLGI